ncbi:neuronal acetylcholine receptor subunit beta-4-like [Haliotis rufescens]|uniref:neuronal acetylcholine receptor subunit beta-4-like n=1 Tax=Haliotis rufescens TaxID=6454 RepID=UPI00201EF7C5|nr:neuronal acetylcholine receptor subunit beta-4-like [Haliotis rufescens]
MEPRLFSLVLLMMMMYSSFQLMVTATIDDEFNLIKDVIEKRSLFSKCDPQSGRIVHINVIFYPMFIIELNEREQVLTSSGWIDLWWTDSRLTWNASNYGGIDKMCVKQNMIWIPDIITENSVAGLSMLGSGQDFVIVHSNGEVEWSPGNIFKTICEIDVVTFPFDSQQCSLNITSWMYYSNEISFVPTKDSINMDFFKSNSEWKLLNISISETVSSFRGEHGIQKDISFVFKLKRFSVFYVVKIIIPVVILSILNSFVFIVPPESGEKVSMSVTTMLSLTVFLSYIGDITPNNSESIPIIALFVVLHLALGALSIICNILILNIHHKAMKEKEKRDLRRETRVNRSNNNEPEEVTMDTIPNCAEIPDGTKAERAMIIMRHLDMIFFAFFILLSAGVTIGCVAIMLI